MTEQQNQGHGAHVGPDVQAGGPSIWPFATGVAALLVGVALIWWSKDTGDNVASVFLGQSIIVALLAVGAWIYEDARSGRYARTHAVGEPRYTQVMTFAVTEGQLEAARADGGVVSELEAQEGALRALEGFQSLRIVVSPAETGPSQVLVETAWASRSDLAGYDQTRRTLLDVVNEHGGEIEAGTVQVFDMEVVRETKDIPVRLGIGTAATVAGALVIGGFFVGAGLALFDEDGGASGGGVDGGPPAFNGVIQAKDIKFIETDIKLPPNAEVTLTMDNQDPGTPHNIQFFTGPSTDGELLGGCIEGCENPPALGTAIEAGPVQQTFTFTTPGPGTYAFWCQVHPSQMVGTLTVEEGAPLPGQSGGGGGAAATEQTISAKDIKFDKTELSFPADTEVTLTFASLEATPHNIEIWDSANAGEGALLQTCVEGCVSPPAVSTEVKAGPFEDVFTFKTPGPGNYAFRCVVHPAEMLGVMIVQ